MSKIRKNVTYDVVTLDAGTSCQEAAKVMSERRIGSVAVKDGDRIVGLVTERDLVATVLAAGAESTTPIRNAMRASIPMIDADADEIEAAAMMRDHYTRHLLVQEGGKPIGIVSMRDVIQLMLDEKQFLISQLNTYIFGR